jgi:hypothetical protein
VLNFGRNINQKFSKCSSIPSVVNGYSKKGDIAEAFSESFSKVYFNSYDDNDAFVECLNRMHSAVIREEHTNV